MDMLIINRRDAFKIYDKYSLTEAKTGQPFQYREVRHLKVSALILDTIVWYSHRFPTINGTMIVCG